LETKNVSTFKKKNIKDLDVTGKKLLLRQNEII